MESYDPKAAPKFVEDAQRDLTTEQLKQLWVYLTNEPDLVGRFVIRFSVMSAWERANALFLMEGLVSKLTVAAARRFVKEARSQDG